MTGAAVDQPNAPFGLTWGAGRAAVRSRFSTLRPIADAEHALVYYLSSITDLIWAQGAFCPNVLTRDPDRPEDEVVFDFKNDRLGSVFVRFGYGFQHIGQDPDTLSEQAMSSFARAEFHDLVGELSARYGPPRSLSETQNRSKSLHVQGVALFATEDAGVVQLHFGHDGGGSLVGELKYRAQCEDRRGF